MAEESNVKVNMILQELVRRTNEESRRLRELEQRLQAVESRSASLEETTLERVKKLNDKFHTLEATIRNVGDDMLKVKNSIEKINRQVSEFAMKKDVKEIERMFELLNPVREEASIRHIDAHPR